MIFFIQEKSKKNSSECSVKSQSVLLVNHGRTILLSISTWIATNKIFQNIQTLITMFLWLDCWLHTYTWNLLLTEFSKRFQRFFFSNGFVNKIAGRQICLTLILVLCSNEDSHCYVPYIENPLPINQIHENQIFLQITILKPPYQIWSFKGVKKCLLAKFDETFAWTISYQGSSQYSKPCWLACHLSKSFNPSLKIPNKQNPSLILANNQGSLEEGFYSFLTHLATSRHHKKSVSPLNT